MSGTQQFVHQKWPDKIFPMVKFVFSHDGHLGLGLGAVQEGGGGGGLLLRLSVVLMERWPRDLDRVLDRPRPPAPRPRARRAIQRKEPPGGKRLGVGREGQGVGQGTRLPMRRALRRCRAAGQTARSPPTNGRSPSPGTRFAALGAGDGRTRRVTEARRDWRGIATRPTERARMRAPARPICVTRPGPRTGSARSSLGAEGRAPFKRGGLGRRGAPPPPPRDGAEFLEAPKRIGLN